MRFRFDLHQLNIFCTVVELQSFSRAAKKLYLSQPTVSDHVKNLEESLGTDLLDRRERKVRPTRAGLVLYEYARKIIALSRESEGALAELLKPLEGEIQIGSSPYLGEYVLPEKIAEFQKVHPEVKISLKIAKGKEIIKQLISGKLQLGAIGQKLNHPRLKTRLFFEDRIILAAPAGHPLSRRKIISFPMLRETRIILREEGSQTRQTVERLLAGKFKSERADEIFKNTIEIGSCSAVKEAMKKGLGIAFLPEYSIQEELQAGDFQALNLAGTPIPRNSYLVYSSAFSESPLGKALISYLAPKKS